MELKKQMEKKNINKKRVFAISCFALLLVGSGFATFLYEVVEEGGNIEEAVEDYQKSWKPLSAINVSVTNGVTGIVNFGTYAHQSSPYTLYDSALTEANFYEHFDGTPTCGEELEGTTPFGTLFDMVLIVQWDYDHAYNGSGWDKDLVKGFINVTCAGDSELNSVASEVMLEGDFYDIDGVNDAKMNMYIVGTGGFDIDADVTFTVDNIKLYYWG